MNSSLLCGCLPGESGGQLILADVKSGPDPKFLPMIVTTVKPDGGALAGSTRSIWGLSEENTLETPKGFSAGRPLASRFVLSSDPVPRIAVAQTTDESEIQLAVVQSLNPTFTV